MKRGATAFLACLLATSCSKPGDPPSGPSQAPTSSVLVIKVDGMQRGEGGKTGMAGPEAVKKALEGLSGVAKVEMDLERDLFRVTIAAKNGAARDSILAAIHDLGYRPSFAPSAEFRATPEPTHPTGGAPQLVQKACEHARAERKLVLVDCMGDSGAACKKMSVKTFADPEVKMLLDEHFVFVELNVDHQQEAAAWFKGEAIPDTGVLSADGRMLDRVVGFMEPKEFAARLRRILERR